MNEDRCSNCYTDEDDSPEDYERCGECGYDHAYEPQESQKAHEGLKG